MSNENTSGLTFLLAAMVVALGIAAAGFFVSQTLYNSNVAINVAEVKGLAERRVKADIAYWTIGFTVTGASREELPQLYLESEQAQARIEAVLYEKGIAADEIKPGVIDYQLHEYRDENQKVIESRHLLVGTLEVETTNVALVEQIRTAMNRLVATGLDINNQSPQYLFTKLNDIKPDMLREATTNARIAANEFAANAGVEVGGIRSARQGGFVIRDVGENYGDKGKIDKEVRVVTNVSFYLTAP